MDVNELLENVASKAKKPLKKPTVKSKDESFDNVMSSISKNWTEEPSSDEVSRLKKELEKARKRIEDLELSSLKLSKNEEKILNAIRSEAIEQGSNTPIISTSMLRSKYKVSAKYQGQSIKSLIEKSFIERAEAPYSGNVKTYSWKLLK